MGFPHKDNSNKNHAIKEYGMQKKSELFVMTKVKDLAKYVINITEKSPKMFRFTLVVRLQNYCLDIIENVYFANLQKDISTRLNFQAKAKELLSMLDYMSGLAYEQKCILFKQYEQISKQIAECLLYLNKWTASTKKSASTSE